MLGHALSEWAGLAIVLAYVALTGFACWYAGRMNP
jgi:hypothetical protein